MQLKIVLAAAALGAGAAQAAPATLPNLQGFEPSRAAPLARLQLTQRTALARGGYRSQFDEALGVPTFLWAPSDAAVPPVGALKRDALPEARARAWLGRQAGLLGLGRNDVDSAVLLEASDRGRGPVLVRFAQRVAGVEVFNRRLKVMLGRDGRPVAVSGYFSRGVDADALPKGRLDAAQALRRALDDLGAPVSGALLARGQRAGYTEFGLPALAGGARLSRAPRSKPVYFDTGAGLEPGYYLELIGERAGGRGQFGHGYVVSAVDGRVLFRNTLIAHDFSYRVFADTAGELRPFDGPLGNGYLPTPAVPGESLVRTSATAALVTTDNGPIGNDDPWLPDGATTTEGNNARAYLDLVSPDGYNAGSDVLGQVSSDASFDYPIAADDDPAGADAQQAAIVNLFYINNWLHDLFYAYGFDERAGNAQNDNYGRGGLDGDAIDAEGQDNSGRNNANMLTPGDGSPPRMQMYLFDGPISGQVAVTAPAPLATQLDDVKFTGASFGPNVFEVVGEVELADELSAEPTDGCLGIEVPVIGTGVPALPQPSLLGKIALIDRGNCAFTTKAQFATVSGAIAMIVVNDGDGDPITMGNGDLPINFPGVSTDPLYTLPSVMIRKDDGQRIKDALAAGETVSMRLLREEATDLDGTLDNLIISHEFFHYVSNRLVGDGSGLGNNQGGSMGEGWSDFVSLLLAVREDDAAPVPLAGAYSTGFYVLPDYYFGIRRAPYSTDFSKNCLTFRHIENGVALPSEQCPISFGEDGASNSEVHNAGEIWANMLWESYAALIQAHGYASARERMIGYLIDGLKMTPSSPTYTEARDGILAAAIATDYEDFALISRAFAKRGMGVDAVAPDRSDSGHAGVVESYVALEASAPVLGLIEGDGCDMDGVLDAGETATLDISLLNNGGYTPGSEIGIGIASNEAGLSFGTDSLALKAGAVGETVEVQVEVSLAADVAGPAELSVSLSTVGPDEADEAVRYPEPVTYVLPVDYDLARAADSDDFEYPLISEPDWARQSTGTTQQWALVDEDELLGSGTVWFAPDLDRTTTLSLLTPVFEVPAEAEFSIEWDHYYAFEPLLPIPLTANGYDGGIIEIRIDGGDWVDVTAAGGSFVGEGYTGTISALDGREGFTGSNAGLFGAAALSHEGLEFGTALAGHSAQLRFVVATDELVGDYGWAIDKVSVSGTADPPFLTVAADASDCSMAPPDDGGGDDGDGDGDDDGGSGDGDDDGDDGDTDTGGDDDGDGGSGDGTGGDGSGTGGTDDGDDDSDGDSDGGDAGGDDALGGGDETATDLREPTDHGGALSWSWLSLMGLAALLRRRRLLRA